MKRTLIALALTGLTLGANVAVADWNDFTLEQYWKSPREATFAVGNAQDVHSEQKSKYDLVDNYNN